MDESDINSMGALSGIGLNFSFSTLMAGFVFGVIGFYLFRHGKKQMNYSWVFSGLILMVYPLFVEGAWLNWGIGLAVCGFAYYAR